MKSKLLLFITVVALLFFPKENFGQAPNLGTASSFALFTAAGAFDNTGASFVTGNIGSFTYVPTGFPPGTVINGNIYGPSDGLSATAASDVITAYNDLSAVDCGTTLVLPLAGQVLTPGFYCYGAAATLNGNLTLDGQNDPNALFIIKIGGAFATGVSSNIILTGSASLCNVYWQIGGQFDLADGSVFRGNAIVAGAINLLGTSSLLGRGLSTAGAISLTNNIVTMTLLPASAGTIMGSATVCQGQTGVIYSVAAIAHATDYLWAIPAGATIIAGANTDSITVDFSPTASSGDITVQGSNSCGTGQVSAAFVVTVNPLPDTYPIWHQ